MLSYLVLDVVTKHANDSDFLALNQISEVNPLLADDVSDHGMHFKMLYHDLKGKYAPNGGQYLQIVSGKDLYDQTIVIYIRENRKSDLILIMTPENRIKL